MLLDALHTCWARRPSDSRCWSRGCTGACGRSQVLNLTRRLPYTCKVQVCPARVWEIRRTASPTDNHPARLIQTGTVIATPHRPASAWSPLRIIGCQTVPNSHCAPASSDGSPTLEIPDPVAGCSSSFPGPSRPDGLVRPYAFTGLAIGAAGRSERAARPTTGTRVASPTAGGCSSPTRPTIATGSLNRSSAETPPHAREGHWFLSRTRGGRDSPIVTGQTGLHTTSFGRRDVVWWRYRSGWAGWWSLIRRRGWLQS